MDGGIDETINTMAWRGMYKVIGETNAFIANMSKLLDKVLFFNSLFSDF